MRQKGIPTYTRYSVAFPDSPLGRGVKDSLSVSFAARGGGTHGEFSIDLHDLGSNGDGIAIRCFTDGLTSLLDERVLDILQTLRVMEAADRVPTFDGVQSMLDAAGFVPSEYHLRGLLDSNPTMQERAALDKQLRRLKRQEEAR
jgi:hypothetical protein